jgi:OmpA-OmpF porin, OOP family
MKRIHSYFTILFILSFTITLFSQTTNENLYQEAKGLLTKAQDAGASIFTKADFEKGNELFSEAENMIKKSEKSEDISLALINSIEIFKKCIENSKMMNTNFTGLMKTRQLTLNNGISESTQKIWREAEDNFISAVEEFADKNLEGTKKYSDIAEKLYKDAELIAIKDRYILPVNQSVLKAEDEGFMKLAPITLKKCKQLILETENILNNNRYDTTKARSTINLALYELNHGLYMHKIFKKMEEEEKTMEDLQLKLEDPLSKVAAEYKIPPLFDSGFENVTSKIIQNISDERTKLTDAKNENQKLTSNIEELNKSTDNYKTSLAGEKKTNQKLSAVIDSLRKANAILIKSGEEDRAKLALLEGENIKYKSQSDILAKNAKLLESISSMFLPSEAEVINNGDLIVIRLVNLNFPQNKATLEPQYFTLLTKVQKAIQTFPNGTAVIEGHTDGVGDYQKNLELSQNRASSVYQYLMSTMGADASRISSVGLGGTKPIANNASEEGRAKNRRIEIVINPHLEEAK